MTLEIIKNQIPTAKKWYLQFEFCIIKQDLVAYVNAFCIQLSEFVELQQEIL
jgi:hypothetical protein